MLRPPKKNTLQKTPTAIFGGLRFDHREPEGLKESRSSKALGLQVGRLQGGLAAATRAESRVAAKTRFQREP